MIARGVRLDVDWCVLSGAGERESEAKASAAEFLSGAASSRVEIMTFRDGFFPEQGDAIKSWFESLKVRTSPDVILTHRRDDAHQDHRQLCQLTWNTFRNHCILEYEIPKWDGDMGQPNLYVSISADLLQRKIDLLNEAFRDLAPQPLVRCGNLSRIGPAPGHGMSCSRTLCGSFFARKLAVI